MASCSRAPATDGVQLNRDLLVGAGALLFGYALARWDAWHPLHLLRHARLRRVLLQRGSDGGWVACEQCGRVWDRQQGAVRVLIVRSEAQRRIR